jgi:hypothetical protein
MIAQKRHGKGLWYMYRNEKIECNLSRKDISILFLNHPSALLCSLENYKNFL